MPHPESTENFEILNDAEFLRSHQVGEVQRKFRNIQRREILVGGFIVHHVFVCVRGCSFKYRTRYDGETYVLVFRMLKIYIDLAYYFARSIEIVNIANYCRQWGDVSLFRGGYSIDDVCNRIFLQPMSTWQLAARARHLFNNCAYLEPRWYTCVFTRLTVSTFIDHTLQKAASKFCSVSIFQLTAVLILWSLYQPSLILLNLAALPKAGPLHDQLRCRTMSNVCFAEFLGLMCTEDLPSLWNIVRNNYPPEHKLEISHQGLRWLYYIWTNWISESSTIIYLILFGTYKLHFVRFLLFGDAKQDSHLHLH